MSKEGYKSLYQTSEDDSGIPRQARLDSNSQTTKPNSRTEVKRELLLSVCLTSEDGRSIYS